MTTLTTRPAVRTSAPRTPKQLLLALFGELVLDQGAEPVRTGVVIAALERTGIAAPTTRRALDGLTQSGFLSRERRGREVVLRLTRVGEDVLREAAMRVRGPRPFDPNGTGWTLVTFSIPEDQRRVRHRLRSSLTWEGFAPLRDGLWLAPGEVDLDASLVPMRAELPQGAVTAFHARALESFPIGDSVHAAWDLEAIRQAHEEFIAEWSAPDAAGEAGPLAAMVLLVADWLALLRTDPRLPREYLGASWPAQRSTALYHRLRAALADGAHGEFAALAAGREPAASV